MVSSKNIYTCKKYITIVFKGVFETEEKAIRAWNVAFTKRNKTSFLDSSVELLDLGFPQYFRLSIVAEIFKRKTGAERLVSIFEVFDKIINMEKK